MFSEGASEQSLLTILSKAIFADLRQDCRKSIWAEIKLTVLHRPRVRFDNIAKPYSIPPEEWIPLQNTAFGNIAESEMGVKNTNKQSHRTCVRMSAKDYELLKKKSAASGLSANAWLMAQLETNRPVLHREEETWEAIRFMDEAGREINAIARDFNSGYGTTEHLRHVVHLLGAVYERLYALRKKGYLHAA